VPFSLILLETIQDFALRALPLCRRRPHPVFVSAIRSPAPASPRLVPRHIVALSGFVSIAHPRRRKVFRIGFGVRCPQLHCGKNVNNWKFPHLLVKKGGKDRKKSHQKTILELFSNKYPDSH
jgi:hypothetical protein